MSYFATYDYRALLPERYQADGQSPLRRRGVKKHVSLLYHILTSTPDVAKRVLVCIPSLIQIGESQ